MQKKGAFAQVRGGFCQVIIFTLISWVW